MYQNTKIWEWLHHNVETYDIDVISMSWNYGYKYIDFNSNILPLIDSLYQKGVFMISAIRNGGKYEGSDFPTDRPYVYAVGSIDHENRGKGSDSTYYSKKGYFTGSATSPCNDERIFCSSYGSDTFGEKALDFVMLGNGVPILLQNGSWVYDMGTSFSTPYLAAAALIAIYAFNKGSFHRYGTYKDPSASEIYDLLKSAASSEDIFGGAHWRTRYGWGYVDLLELYNEAYSEAYYGGGSSGGGSSKRYFY